MGFLDFLKPIFGSQSGVLTPTINKVAQATTGGSDSLGGAFHNAIMKGGALQGLDIAKKSALSGLDQVSKKLSNVPLVGTPISGAVDVAKSAVEAIPTSQEGVVGLGKEVAQNLVIR